MTIYLNSRLLAPASLSIFLAIFPAVATNNETPSTAPQAPEILGCLKIGHPRLLASVQDFAALKKRIASDPKLETWHTTLRIQAEKLLTAAPSQYEIPDGLRLLATSRENFEDFWRQRQRLFETSTSTLYVAPALAGISR